MTVPGAFVIRDASLTIDDNEVASAVYKARLIPDTPIQTLRTMVPTGVVQDVDNTSWTFEISAVQDWTATTGICTILNAANYTTVTVALAPKTGGKNATFDIVVVPVDFGGDQGAFNTFDATFAVVGQPTFGTDS